MNNEEIEDLFLMRFVADPGSGCVYDLKEEDCLTSPEDIFNAIHDFITTLPEKP